jgi:hypothetical protein
MSRITPIWRTGAYAGVFADAYVKNTELEGGNFASAVSTQVRVTFPYPHFSAFVLTPWASHLQSWQFVPHLRIAAARTFEDGVSHPGGAGSSSPMAVVAEAADLLLDAARWSKLMRRHDTVDKFIPILRKYQARLQSLPVGSITMLPGGWR